MEKISRIIPASPRTRTAEIATAQPARPGAPAMGRTMGRSTSAPSVIEDRITLSNAEKSMSSQGTYRPPAEVSRTKIVDDLAQKFFNSKADTAEITKPKSEQVAELAQESTPEIEA